MSKPAPEWTRRTVVPTGCYRLKQSWMVAHGLSMPVCQLQTLVRYPGANHGGWWINVPSVPEDQSDAE